MSTAAPPKLPRLGLADRITARPRGATWAVLAVAAVMLVSLWLRTRAIDAGFWIDEGLSVGISSHGFFEIPGVLRQDGSPPFYYLLLHLWMQGFGNSEAATHSLSLVFALLSIPAALWAAGSLFGTRAGWIAAALAAINPFLTYYAQETRMYALVAVLGMLVAATWLHLFVNRDRRYLPAFVAVATLHVYSHNYGLFLVSATVVALAAAWRWTAAAPDRKALLRDGLIAYGAIALLYLPWLPNLIFQTLHTGAPWAQRPGVETLLSATGLLVGGTTTGIAILLAGGSGFGKLLEERVTPRGRRAVFLLLITVGAILIAWLTSQVSPAFTNRYMSSFFGPVLLVAAVGLAHAGRLGLVALLIVALFWFDPRTSAINTKSNARSFAAQIQTYVTAGDLIVSTHPEQLPLLAYYLPEGVRYATSLGFVPDRDVMDWRDVQERLKEARPKKTIEPLVVSLRPGQELVLVQPILRTARWQAPWTALVRRRAVQWERRLDADPRLRREAVVPVFGFDRLPRGVRAVVYRRVSER